MSVALPNGQAVVVLNAITAAATGPFDGAKVVLFQSNTTLLPTTVLADLTICDFSGYATSSAIVWADAGFDAQGDVLVTGGTKSFARTAGAVSNDVYGYALVDGTATDLLWARKFPQPIPMAVVGQTLIVLPVLTLGQPPDLGPNDVV